MNLQNITDDVLALAFRESTDPNAVFMEVVRRFKERVYHHVRRILIDHDDANDAAQNTFIRVWQNMDKFRGDCALFSWIYRIATNEALMLLRKKRGHLSLEDAANELMDIMDAGALMGGEEIEMRLQKELVTLPEKQRLVFHLKYFDELTYEQMSEVTGTSVGALKASYFYAVKKLEEQLKRQL